MGTTLGRLRYPLVVVGLVALTIGGLALWQSGPFGQCGVLDRSFGRSGCIARLAPDGWNPPGLGSIVWPTHDALVIFDNVPADWPGEEHRGPSPVTDGSSPERWVDLVKLDPATGEQIDRVRLPIAVADWAYAGPDGTQAVLASAGMFASNAAGGNSIVVSTIDGSVLAMPSEVTHGPDHRLIEEVVSTRTRRLVPGTDDRIVSLNEGLQMPLALFDRETDAKIRDFGDATFGYRDRSPFYYSHLDFRISADGSRLALIHTNPPASVGADAVIRVWRIADGVELASFQIPTPFRTERTSLFLSPDGGFVGVRTFGPNSGWPIFGTGPTQGIHVFRVPED